MRQRTMAAAEAEGYASLTQLAAALRQSAGQTATISLDESFLTQAVLQILVNALQLPSGTTEVVLENADPTKITFSSDNQTLFIVGAQFSETVLNLDAAPAMVAIQQTSESNFGYNLIVNVGLAPGWTFGTSFPPLAGLQPPDYIVAEGPCLYVSSFGNAQAIPAFPVSGRCTSNAGASPLLQGLNYYAGIGPTGIFAQIANLITGAGVGPFPIYGTIQPATPEFDVQAPLGTLPSVTIGYITASAATPWLGISAGETAGQLSYYLGTKIDVQSAASAPVSFEIDVTLPTTATQTFTISLASGNSTPLSLGNLASALFNTTQDALTSNVPPMLQGVLTAVGSIQLQTLTGTFSLPTGSSSA
ncbi:MAG TPA: hypothetical protein VGS58_06570, partial [Candidatus Sulfopaludibacter sp.]|nr:hypothetical protein [Candidatus Sulfopaludibacter sp.]